MADADVLVTAGSGTKIDTRTVGAGTDEHRQVMVIGDPVTAANVAVVDASGRLLVVRIGALLYANGQVAPTATAATLLAARATRSQVTFQNTGSVPVYIGAATVTTANGFLLDVGAAFTMTAVTLIQAITPAGTGAVAYFEEYN